MADKQTNMADWQEKDVPETTTTMQVDHGDKEREEIGSTVSTKIQSLRNNKKFAESRMTKAKKQLSDLTEKQQSDVALPSKNAVKRAIIKVDSEMNIIIKIIGSLREVYAMTENNEEINSIIETLDKELEDIGSSADVTIVAAEKHLEDRLKAGETESVSFSSIKSKYSDVESVLPSEIPSKPPSKVPPKPTSEVPPKLASEVPPKPASEEPPKPASEVPPKPVPEVPPKPSSEASCKVAPKSQYKTPPKTSSHVEKKQSEAKEVNERLERMKKEQEQKEQQMKKLAAELELSKQRTKEAQKIAEMSKSRAESAEQLLAEEFEEVTVEGVARTPIKLKVVELPKFSGEDKTSYEPRPAFMAMVDANNIPVGEKMLRLQSSLSEKALTLVKDLGYSSAAYERTKLKLGKRYGGERRQQITHLTTLCNCPKVRYRNLHDLEQFQALLERILITTNGCGSLQDQSLNLSANEKLTEQDVQSYKHWLLHYARQDCFESLVDWVELRVQMMEESREDTEGIGRRNDEQSNRNRDKRQRSRGFSTRSSNATRHCIVNTCKQDHSPLVCEAFKKLPASTRKELISKSSRC